MGRIDRILRAVEGDPWAIQLQKLNVLAEVLCAKVEAGQIPTASDIEAAEARARGAVAVSGAIAVLPMFGTISRRMGMMGAMSGGVSIETFSKNFAELVADDGVSAIVFQVDSPGGSVYGVDELSAQIFEARSKKRIIAVVDPLMASAAYYIASAADEIVMSPSAEVGSLGVYTVHFDHSEMLEDAGVKVTIIKAGERKAEGNPFEELGEEAAAHMQAKVDAFYDQFINAVARNMGVTRAKVEADFGQGLTLTADKALERGMVHRIATFDQVIADLRGSKRVSSAKAFGADSVDLPIAALEEMRLEGTLSYTPAGETLEEIQGQLSQTLSGSYRLFDIHNDTKTITEAASGHVAEVPKEPAPTEPAPEAMEDSVDDVKDTATAPTGGATAEELAAAIAKDREVQRDRQKQIRAICSEHKIDSVKTESWASQDISVEDVNKLVLDEIKTRAEAEAVIGIQVGDDRETRKPFLNFGEQLMAVVAAENSALATDPRLLGLNAAATGSGGAVPADGGFLVQPEFASEILRRVYTLGEVVTRVRRRPIGPNADGLKINAVAESSRVTGSRYGGVQVYWADEGDTVTPQKPSFRVMELYLRKLMGLWYVTDELLKDAVALEAIGVDAFSEEINFMVEDAIFRGTGAGQPLGFLNSASKVEVAKESAQTALTINKNNVLKMFGRMWPRSRSNAVWFINVDCEHQLPLMTIGNQPVYLPPGGLSNSPLGTLLGRPVVPVEYCETLGTAGDIILADLSQYLMIDKGQTEQAWSMHVRFLNDEMTFRIKYRVDGQPVWKTPLTPYKGTNTLSPFITLAARA